MDYVKMFEDKALNSPNRMLYDSIYNQLTDRQKKTLQNISNKWYRGNTNKTKIELLAETKTMNLIKEPIYKETTDLFDNEIIGYKEDTLLNSDDGKRLKLNKSEVVYFKAIRECITE